MNRIIALVLYYGVAWRIPAYVPVLERFGRWLRAKCFSSIALAMGDNVNIRPGVYMGAGRGLRIGSKSGLGDECRLYMAAPISIGRNVMVGPQCMFLTGNHGTSDPTRTLIEQKVLARPILIDDDVWIGARVTLCPGAIVRSRTIIAAGSVVIGEIGPKAIYAGVPAKKIRDIE